MLYFRSFNLRSFAFPFPNTTFVYMKKFLLVFITAVGLSVSTTVHAQFYSVDNHNRRYKVKVITPQTKKKAPLSRDTSSIKQPSVIDSMATNDFTTNKPVTASSQISFPLQNIYITSPYGYRNDPFTAKRKFHNGIDLRANYEPCYAILDGIVERIGNDKRSGKFITLRHGNYTISYCHLSHILVPQGRPVQAGTPIAITGSTGCSTAPHLHLSIKYKRKSIDAKVLLDYIVHSKGSKFWCQGVNQ